MKLTLRGWRGERGVVQLALAADAGIADHRYWRIENGYQVPTDAERAAIARVLGVQVDDITWPAQADTATRAFARELAR